MNMYRITLKYIFNFSFVLSQNLGIGKALRDPSWPEVPFIHIRINFKRDSSHVDYIWNVIWVDITSWIT